MRTKWRQAVVSGTTGVAVGGTNRRARTPDLRQPRRARRVGAAAGRTANEWHGKDGNRGWDPQTQPSSLANGDEYRREAAMAVIAGKTRQMVEATNSQVVYWWRQPPEM